MATPLTRTQWLEECGKMAKTYEDAMSNTPNMTDEAKALVERLRERITDNLLAGFPYNRDGDEAADLIEAQAREIERLRGLLREAEVKLTDVQGAYATKRYADNLLARISAALGETFEDLGQEFEAVWDANRDKLYEGYTK